MYRLLLFVFPFLALGKPNNSCVLVFQGAVNRILLPVDVTVLNMPVWRGVDQNGDWKNEYFYLYQTGIWNLQGDYNPANWQLRSGYTNAFAMVDDCPSAPIVFYHWDDVLNKHTAATNVTVPVEPLNTLCWPQPGVVMGYTKLEVLPNANSLSECALEVAKMKNYYYGVQWAVADNHCVAFSSEAIEPIGVKGNLTIYFDKPKYNIYTFGHLGPDLACLLQCNKLPVQNKNPSKMVETDTLEKCVTEGERYQKSSVSFQDKKNCFMYDNPEYEAGDNISQYCDVLPSYKVPGVTPITTSTTTASPSTVPGGGGGGQQSHKKNVWVYIGSAGGGLGAILIVAGGILFYKKTHKDEDEYEDELEEFEGDWGTDIMEQPEVIYQQATYTHQQANWNSGHIPQY